MTEKTKKKKVVSDLEVVTLKETVAKLKEEKQELARRVSQLEKDNAILVENNKNLRQTTNALISSRP